MTGQASSVHKPRKVVSLLLGGALGAAAVAGVPAAGAEPYPAHRATIRYDLTGAGTATYITYQTNNGQAHAVNVALPWSVELSGWATNDDNAVPYVLSAQGPGALTCRISVNGKVVSESTAAGTPARVVCQPTSKPRTTETSTP